MGDGEQGRGAVERAPRATSPTREYQEFYKQISYDQAAPLAYTHNRVEGRSEYTQLLYIPSKAPFDLWNRDKRGGVKLYVKRVFIMDDAEALMPVYLRFVKGVIDSADLPLNVQPRAAAGKPRRQGHPRRLDQARAGHAGVAGRQRGRGRARQVRRLLEGLRRGAEGRHRRGPCQPGAAGQAAALCQHAGRCGRVLRRLRQAHEGRPGGHLLHHRRQPGHGQEQPAAGDLPQEGHRGAAAGRTASTSGC